jgi:hypothetical protein
MLEEKLEAPPGRIALPHGADCNLRVDEVGGVQLVEPAISAGP